MTSIPRSRKTVPLLIISILVLVPISTLPVSSVIVEETSDGETSVDIALPKGGGTYTGLDLTLQADAYIENATLRMEGKSLETMHSSFFDSTFDFISGDHENISLDNNHLNLEMIREEGTTPHNWSGTDQENISVKDGEVRLQKSPIDKWKSDSMVEDSDVSAVGPWNDHSLDMAVDGHDTVHLAYIGSDNNAYYVRSSNKGDTWTDPLKLNSDVVVTFVGIFVGPQDNLHLFFVQDADGGPTTYYKRSTDGGQSFSTRSNWQDTGLFSPLYPDVVWDSEGTMHVTAQDYLFNAGTFYYDIFYFNSTDNGINFRTAVRVDDDTNRTHMRQDPDIAVGEQGEIHLTWIDHRNAANPWVNRVFYSSSTDHHDFTINRAIDPSTGCHHSDPTVQVDGNGKVHVLWADNRSGSDFDVYHMGSDDGGSTFSSDVQVNDDPTGEQTDPDMVLDSQDGLLVTWQDNRTQMNRDVYFSRSTDGGSTFDTPEMVPRTSDGEQGRPRIDIGPENEPHFAWKDGRGSPIRVMYNHKYHPYSSRGSVNGSLDLGHDPAHIETRAGALVPPDTVVQVYIRTSPDQSTWSNWESVDLVDDTISIEPDRYIGYHIVLRTNKDYSTPTLSNLSVNFSYYPTTGTYISKPMTEASVISMGWMEWNVSLGLGEITVYLSNNNGTTWKELPSPGIPVEFSTSGTTLRYRLVFGGPGNSTPVLYNFTVVYWLQSLPSYVGLDVGGTGLPDHVHIGPLDGVEEVDLTMALRDHLASIDGDEMVTVPIHVISSSAGSIVIDQIRVVLDIPPAIQGVIPNGTTPSVEEADTLEFSINASDPDGVGLNYSWTLDGTSLEGITTPDWTFSPDYDQQGIHEVTVRVSDGRFSKNHSWDVSVVNVNRPPVLNSYSPTGQVGNLRMPFQDLLFRIEVMDPDDDPISYTWTLNEEVLPAVSGNNWTLLSGGQDTGEYLLRVSASDGRQNITLAWSFTILPPLDHPPVITALVPDSPVEMNPGDEMEFRVNATDEDGDVLTYSWSVNDVERTGVTAGDRSSAWFLFKPPKKTEYTVRVEIDDGTNMICHEWVVKVTEEEQETDVEGGAPWMLVVLMVAALVIIFLMFMIRHSLMEAEEGPEEKGRPPKKESGKGASRRTSGKGGTDPGKKRGSGGKKASSGRGSDSGKNGPKGDKGD